MKTIAHPMAAGLVGVIAALALTGQPAHAARHARRHHPVATAHARRQEPCVTAYDTQANPNYGLVRASAWGRPMWSRAIGSSAAIRIRSFAISCSGRTTVD